MKPALFLVFLFGVIGNGAAQVHGRFVAVAGQPVAFANVSLLRSEDSAFVKAALTDSLGNYTFPGLASGGYFLRCSSVGYQTFRSPDFRVLSGEPDSDLGAQTMTENKQQLDAVVVRGRGALVQSTIEGTVVHAESSVLTKGSTILEVLERSPGVMIDRRNNRISLNGKNGVSVMLDGKALLVPEDEVVNMLGGMNADNLDKLELLTTPSARYDASGNAGVINIVLKKSRKQGTSGALSLTGGYGWGEKGGASVNLDHNTGKLDWFGSYSFSHDRRGTTAFADGSEIIGSLGGPASFEYWNLTRETNNSHNAVAGVDAQPGKGFTLGGSVTYNYSGAVTDGNTNAYYTIPPDSVLAFDSRGRGKSHWNNVIASIHAEKIFRPGEKLGLATDWISYSNDRPTNVTGTFTDSHGEAVTTANDSLFSPGQRGYSHTTIRIGVGKADYSRQVSPGFRLEAGVKGTYTQSSSLSGIESLIDGGWVTSVGAVNAIGMREGIGAAYLAGHAAAGASMSLDIGLRYEYSRTRLNNAADGASIDDRKLGVLFPSVLVVRKLNDHAALQLSYTRRITRPSYKDLSSFILYNDPLSVFSGNPLLKPTITNNLKLGYSNRGYTFSVLLSRDDNPIVHGAITAEPGSGLVYLRPENLVFQNNLTLEANLPVKINDWWEMDYGFVGGWRQFKADYTLLPAEKTYFGYSANFRETFKLPAGYTAEVSGWYNGPGYYGLNRDDGYGSVNVGMRKQLHGNRGSLQFTAMDIFRSLNIRTYIGTVGEDAFYTKAFVSYNEETRRFPILKLTWSRSFGSGQKTHADQGGSGDERDRIR
jgi:iron complex outermembrane receptor protein